MNLFEQQAQQDQRMVQSLREMFSKENAPQFIAHASTEQCKVLVDALADRLCQLEGIAFGLDDVRYEIGQCLAAKEDAPLCPACSGSGEGQYEGATCWRCKGTGTERKAA